MLYMVTFTINIPPMLAYIPYMDPMGKVFWCQPQEGISRHWSAALTSPMTLEVSDFGYFPSLFEG